jgi:hypothetical protein
MDYLKWYMSYVDSQINTLQVWINLDGYFQDIHFSKWTEWTCFVKVWFMLKKYSSNLEICPILQKKWADCDDSHCWVIKSTWIGFKIGIHALHLWYELLWKSHKYWIRDTSVLKCILSHMCISFLHAAVRKMRNLAAIEKSNEAQIFMARR